MNHKTQIGGFILAGGESSRMGRDKALLELAGETLIARTANLIASVAGTCAIIGDPNRLVESARFVAAERSVETVGSSGAMRVDEAVQSGDAERWRGAVNKAMAHNMSESGLRVIGDDFPGAGPLGGIATALRVSSAEWSLVVACDLPYLTREWLEFLIGRALRSDADAVVPMNERGAEPLCAMYRKRAEGSIRAALDRGTRKVTDGLAGVRIEFIEPAEWKGFDSDGLLFKNMNSPADYEEAKGRFEPRLKR
jgi:molybdopterin-guanine dinucleotide biosynthesis protein A